MKIKKGNTKIFVSETIGIIPYKVARVGRSTVNIIISRGWWRFFRKSGVNLRMLKNIGSRNARSVMKRLIKSTN